MEEKICINAGRPVYFSYARNSQRKPEWEHISDCVDPLLNTMTVNGLEYRVDVKDIGMGDKISKFEEEIGWNSEVVVIIFSDKYFRSMHCMYEFVQIKKALQQYPEKRLMCIKSGDFNLADFNYIMELEQYWYNQQIEYEKIDYHRLREHSGTEIAAHENGFYLEDIRKLYSFFSAINYSNATSINYNGFVGDIVRYYKTTPKPKLTPKPTKSATQQQTYTAQPQSSAAYTPSYTAQPQPATKKSPVIPIAIAAVLLGFVIYFFAGKNTTTTEQTTTPSNTDNNENVAALVTISDNETDAEPAPTDNNISTHEYVDLGLPSGTLWATCNVGANAPEEYGDYFAWGETETKSTYSWDNYKYGDYEEFTKYSIRSNDGYNGFVDNRTTLERSDDVAYQKWGSDWCMPTREQFEELHEECTWTWTSRGGNNGYEVKSPNGNTIFLPAAGSRGAEELSEAGSYGEYLSSSLRSNWSIDAKILRFNSDGVYTNDDNVRYCGNSVRAVRCRN